jgi:hypothetical protein
MGILLIHIESVNEGLNLINFIGGGGGFRNPKLIITDPGSMYATGWYGVAPLLGSYFLKKIYGIWTISNIGIWVYLDIRVDHSAPEFLP